MLSCISPVDEIDFDAITDQELWKSFIGGNCLAFEQLFNRFYDDLYHYGVKFSNNPEMAEDHIQQLFVKLWQKRNDMEEVKGVKTYLWTALRRSMIDTFRKRQAEEKYQQKFRKMDARMQLTAEEVIINEEVHAFRHSELKEAIDQLSPQKREALYLKFYEGMTYEEIGEIMSLSYQTSRNYIYKALKSLRATLQPEKEKAIPLHL